MTSQSKLAVHVLTHSGEKMHICLECDKSFGQAGNLKIHMVTHSKERTYTCVHCNKSFSLVQYLRTHMLTHSGVSPTLAQNVRNHLVKQDT